MGRTGMFRNLLWLLAFVAVLAHPRVQAQGQFNFSNLAGGVDAPFFDCDALTRLSGTAYWVQPYAGSQVDSLTPVGTAVSFGTGMDAGYFFGGIQGIPTTAPGSSILLQARVWSAPFMTWEAAYGAQKAGDPSARADWSNIIALELGGGAVPIPNLVGLQSLALACVPEPGLIHLGLLAALALGRRGQAGQGHKILP
jgi:hypothetical protein